MSFFLLSLIGCIEEVDPKGLLNTERKVVINSIISPQLENITVEVSLSVPLLGVKKPGVIEDDIVQNATVTLSDGDMSINLPFNDTGQYSIKSEQFPIEAGRSYFLSVTVGSTEYKSSCKIPEAKTSDFKVSSSKVSDGQRLRFTWQDPQGEENFYRLSGSASVSYSSGSYQESFYFDNGGFKTDLNRDGQTISIETDVYIEPGNVLDSARLQILTADENYYNYQKTVYDHGDSDENPFAEPVRLVSNIEGENVLGIFAAYQSVEHALKVEN